MYFCMDGRVRYSEVDADGNLTIDGIVNYLQDCCMLHSEEVGSGLNVLKEMKTVWFLSAWQIQILQVPRLYERIRVTTNPYEMKGFFGFRNFWIDNEAGTRLVLANSIWVYLDRENGRPLRIHPAVEDAYKPFMPKLEMDYAPRKMRIPEGMTALPPVPVHKDQIDTNRHVNNCAYIRTAMEAADMKALPREIRVEYRKQAVFGDTFFPYIYRSDHACIVDLRDADGGSYAPVMFLF